MTNDINYVWCDQNPTIFNASDFNLTLDHTISMIEMKDQAKSENEVIYLENSLLRLNQFNVHKVNESDFEGMRTFLKITFSKDQFDLIGNTHNYQLEYNWGMKPRNTERNVPQSKINQ